MDDLDFVPSIASDEDIIDADYGDDTSQFDGERCGICMDVIIDRGVLDCCQHWFCFTCVDNWSTITNLCPLCQNEFQMITCVPVYDTIGSNKFEEESSSREDDWCIEGNNNSLSFPSYYIDEDVHMLPFHGRFSLEILGPRVDKDVIHLAVICLDGSGCKIRGGVSLSEGYGSEDTSIACDSCDIWYHAFCVGFDPEGESETWLCPRCMAIEMPQALSSSSIQASSYNQENASNECVFQNAFSRKVSVSVADSGETALVVSILPGNQVDHLPNDVKVALTEDTPVFCSNAENIEDEHLYLPTSSGISSETKEKTDTNVENLPSMSRSKELFEEFCTNKDPGTNWSQHGHGVDISPELSVSASSVHGPGTFKSKREVEMVQNIASYDVSLHMPSTTGDLSELFLEAGDVMDDHEKDATNITLIKGEHLNSCGTADPAISEAGETKVSKETEVSVEKIKVEAKDGPSSWQEGENALHSDSQNGTVMRLEDDKDELNQGRITDIMTIVRGTRKRPSEGHEENAARVRVKKIMRRTIKDKDSSMVQSLSEEIREAVQNKSSNIEENLSDPKLLAAFRAVIAGTEAEPVPKISRLAVKAKKSLLQKGKVRESLTRKIYATNNGKRKRAWDRECDVEFWKYRCMRTTKPEKMETLRSVLDILRGNPMNSLSAQESDQPATSSILSRLYLADTSVMPRKDDLKPVTALETVTGKDCQQSSEEPASKSRGTTTIASKSGSSTSHGSKSKINSKHDAAGGSQVGCSKGTAMKAAVATSDDLKSDKRKWALEILARKSASNCKGVSTDGHQDNDLLKGNYPLLAQLPVDMRPELAMARHNKVPVSVRQTQLYCLTEHFLRKADLPVIFRNAETELAVADAVNVEKDVADRSSSKLVYVNLCSQMLLRRQEDKKSSDAAPSHPLSLASVAPDKVKQEVDEYPDSEISGALRAAGLLYDSPPNSPLTEAQPHNGEPDISMAEKDAASDNVVETSGTSDLDVRPDIKGNLDGEEHLRGTGTAESSKQPLDNHASTKAATSSTNYHEYPVSVADDARETEQATAAVEFLPFKNETHAQIGTSPEEHAAAIPCDSGHPSANDKPDDTSMIARDGSCAPERESLGNKECNEASTTTPRDTEADGKSCRAKPSPHKDAGKFLVDVDSIRKKVEAYVKEHIRPLCKSGVITAEQYQWSVAKTAEKVMRYHSKAKNASFLIKEGEKVKRLAEQYVEAAQTRE